MSEGRTHKAIESSDTDELVRIVDGHCTARSWDALVDLRARCDEAVTRGKQLWGVSEYIRYRLALDAPPAWAGPAVTEGRTRFTLGPLPEVAASTKTWTELDPWLAPGPERAMVAHERVVRGEDLTGVEVDPHVLELPLRIEPWEPTYPTIRYFPDRIEAPSPGLPPMPVADLPEAGDPVDDPDGPRALLSLVEHWVEESSGRAQAACVEGQAASAIAALGVRRGGLVEVDPDLALAHMSWASASGAAHAHRRGTAAGRFSAWWVAAELAGLEWPPEPGELGRAAAGMRWYLWSDAGPDTGWALRVAVESPAEGLAWAVSAVDAE